jgi:O-antigen/teichoic acid export membrane protein
MVGAGLPMVAALVTIPFLIRGLGEARFGILGVVWVVIGYFGLFDFGLGRALTKVVAERLGAGKKEELAGVVWTTLLTMLFLGVLGGAALGLVAPWLTRRVLEIPPALQGEALHSFYLMAFALPWVISTTGLLAILEANQRFGVVNALRIPLALFNYVGPVAVLPFSASLVPVVMLLVLGRLLAWGGYLAACLRTLPALRQGITLQWGEMRGLARFGGWMTVSNMVSPLMTHVDRFLIGALISMAAVAYYVTPYEIATKLWLVPTSILGVLFPAFAATFVQNRTRTVALFDRAIRAIFLIMFPAALVIVTLAHEIMDLWLGRAFAANSAGVLQWLVVGVFINCLGYAPFALLQGIGRPDITGKLHLMELPLYVGAIWGFSRVFGLEGVAMAWVLRVSIDTLVLFLVTERKLPTEGRIVRRMGWMAALALLAFGMAALQPGIGAKLAFLGITLSLFGLAAWHRVLAPDERAFVHRRYTMLLERS